MKHTFMYILQMIDQSAEKSLILSQINNFEELYEFFRQNGYEENIHEFKKDVHLMANCVTLENSELNKISGGINSKNKLNKTISAGMASLLMLSSSTCGGIESPKIMCFESSTKKPHAGISKKTIYKILGITGIVSTIGAAGTLGTYGISKFSKKSKNHTPLDEVEPPQNAPLERKSMHFSDLSPISCGNKTYGIREIQQILSLYFDLWQIVDLYDKENNNNQNKIISMLGGDIDVCRDFITSCEKVFEKKLEHIPSYSDIRQFRINLYSDMKKELKNSTDKWSLLEKCQSILENSDLNCIHNISLNNTAVLNGCQFEEILYVGEDEFILDITVPAGSYFGLLILFYEEDIDKPICCRIVPENKPSTTYPLHSFSLNEKCIVNSRALDIMSEVLTNEHGFDEDWNKFPATYPLITVKDTEEFYYHPSGKPIVYDTEQKVNSYKINDNSTTCWKTFYKQTEDGRYVQKTQEETLKDRGTFMLLKQEIFEKCIQKALQELKY